MSLWNSSCILSALSLATDVRSQQPYFCQKFLVYSPLFLALGSLSTILGFWQPCLFQKFSIFSVLSCTTALEIASPVFLNSFQVFQLCFLLHLLVLSVLACVSDHGFFSPIPSCRHFVVLSALFLAKFLILPALFSVKYHCICHLSALFLATVRGSVSPSLGFYQPCFCQQTLVFLFLAAVLTFFQQGFVQMFLILLAGSLKTIPAFLASLLQEILSGFISYNRSCSQSLH